MKWMWVCVVVIASTFGDVSNAKGMAERGEIDDFHPSTLVRVLRYIVTQRNVLLGIAGNAISYLALLALLSMAPLSFAVPATALSYVLETVIAKWYLHEAVTVKRWLGVLLVVSGIVFIAV
ncbi:MAG TPA: EamA family transporter [Bryobacteraceae bacterium]|jgi:drug/metabolite transporter (DMT)-like permease|nr:EamA family transporter [Bryobacteraceae bacterium]